MSEKPDTTLSIRDFQGLALQADPNDLPEGAAYDQVNAQSSEIGKLKVRNGLRVITFEA